MSEKRRALGRGLGALIPSTPAGEGATRPVDVFFKDNSATVTRPGVATPPHEVADNPAITDHTSPGSPSTNGAGPATDRSTPGHAEERPQEGGVHSGANDVESATAEQGSANGGVDAGATEAADMTQTGDTTQTDLAPVPGATYAEIPVNSIRPNPRQPRTVFDEDDMAELVHSIREIGVLQPIVVRPITDGEGDIRFELIMGERRWRATQEAGLEVIPAIIKETEDDDLLRDALLENLHRSQLNALEEAAAYQQLLEDFGCTHDELAGRIGRSRPQISNTLRLLKLPPLVARRVAAGVLSAGHARALLALDDAAAMERLAQRIVAEGLSVRSVEEIVALGGDQERVKPRRPRAGGRHPQLDDLAARLSDRFDTRVNIALGQRKGKLTVEFASVDDLNRIVEMLGLDPRATA
ncbi:ParB/RepB/Spo0J family partition protein [Pedococcus cremeus]|nr:ParB/RepB/Spo0J family partition protein [Pedococcus cremeus]